MIGLSGPPGEPVVLPHALRRLVGSHRFTVEWRNEVGGLTVRVRARPTEHYVKWTPRGSGIDLRDEIERLAWAGPFVTVPTVLDWGADDEGSWFLSRALEGTNAVTPRWRGEPETAARAIGRGLRTLHSGLSESLCPFESGVNSRLEGVNRRAAAGDLARTKLSGEFRGLDVADALLELNDPPDEDVVVCHGDACAPNTLLDARGNVTGHVDLGRLGRGDRWSDLAIAAWSTRWNYGEGYEYFVYDGYGVDPDADKIRYFRLLWAIE